jgi:hypothetical protein
MQIDDTANSRELEHVGLGLTEAEASELRDTLTTLLEDSGERHEHVSSSDHKRELTVWLVRDRLWRNSRTLAHTGVTSGDRPPPHGVNGKLRRVQFGCFRTLAQDGYAGAGTDAVTWVPPPGGDSIVRWPPTASMRSRMFCRP